MIGSWKRFFASTLLAPVLVFGVSAGTAQAYTLYLKPEQFNLNSEQSSVRSELSFATTYFTPDIAVDAPNLHAITPLGDRLRPASLAVTNKASVVGFDTWDDGIYRLSTGERYGRVTDMIFDEVIGWRPKRADEVAPPEARTSTLQTVAVAEAYVTRGTARAQTFEAGEGRLAIRPLQNPNAASTQYALELQLLFDDAPFAGVPFVLNKEGEAETAFERVFVTNEEGVASFGFYTPGVYIVSVRHRSEAPAGSDAAVHSYTTTLTFTVGGEPRPEPPPPPSPEALDGEASEEAGTAAAQ